MKELNHLQACIASAAEVCGSEWMIAWLRIRFPRSEIGTNIDASPYDGDVLAFDISAVG